MNEKIYIDSFSPAPDRVRPAVILTKNITTTKTTTVILPTLLIPE